MTSLLFFFGPELAPGEPEAATAAVPAAARAATAQIVIRSFVRARILLLLSWFSDNRESGRRAGGFAPWGAPGLSPHRPGANVRFAPGEPGRWAWNRGSESHTAERV